MKPIPTLIVDDEPLARRGLRTLLDDDPQIDVVGEASDGDEAAEAIDRLDPELIFLDIAMPGRDGLAVARGLLSGETAVEAATSPVVVFVTAFDRFAVDAFDTEAVDYVLKPFDDARFHRTLERAKRRVRQRRVEHHRHALVTLLDDPVAAAEPPPPATSEALPTEPNSSGARQNPVDRLVIRSTGRIRVVDLAEVDWIAGAGNYVRLHRGESTDLYRASLNDLEKQLDPTRFVRIHRSAIVQVDRVRDLRPLDRGDYRLTLRDGTELKVSRSFRHQLPRLLGGG